MTETTGKGSATAMKAGSDGKDYPRTSSSAQAELGRKGGRSKK